MLPRSFGIFSDRLGSFSLKLVFSFFFFFPLSPHFSQWSGALGEPRSRHQLALAKATSPPPALFSAALLDGSLNCMHVFQAIRHA